MVNESPLPSQVTRVSDLNGYDSTESEVSDLDSANIITSEVAGKPGRHKVVLDIDLPAKLIPSSTEGHFHLMIDKEMDWEDYQRLLWVLADVGIIEEGYASSSDERGYTAVRLPWVRKDTAPPAPRTACGRGWVDMGTNGVPCNCDDCTIESDGRSRAERERDEARLENRPCTCPACVPPRFQGQRADLVITDEATSWQGVQGVSAPPFELSDHQREYLSRLADLPPVQQAPPAPPAVEASAGTVQIAWNGNHGERRNINDMLTLRYANNWRAW